MSTIKLLSGGGIGRRGFSGIGDSSLIPDSMSFRAAITTDYDWKKCAMSRDGKYQVAGFKNGQLFYSIDYGITWTIVPASPIQNWMSICCSQSGNYFYAAGKDGEVYRSNDYGVSWLLVYTDAETNLYDCACSSDGRYVLLAKGTAGIQNQVSADFGATWTNTFPSTYNMKCAVSSTGQTMFLCRHTGVIYKNVNWGVAGSWDGGTNIDVGAGICDCIRCDYSANYLLALFGARWLYASVNGGATWMNKGFLNPSGSLDDPGGDCRLSSNGKIQVYCSKTIPDGYGYLFVSGDYGSHWKAVLPRIGQYTVDFSDNFKYVLRPSKASTLGPFTNKLWVCT